MDHKFSTDGFSVEDILMETGAASSARSSRNWSMEDIDALLADEPSTLLGDQPLEHTASSLFASGEVFPAQEEAPVQNSPAATGREEQPLIFSRADRAERNEGEFAASHRAEEMDTIKTADVRLHRPEEPEPEERTRFFNKITPEEMKRRPAKTIDSPGFIRRESGLHATADLSPLPMIVAADAGIEEPERVKAPAVPEDSIEGQMFFSDFLQGEDPVEQIDERRAELELRQKRRERVKNFKINEEFRDSAEFGEPLPPDEETGEHAGDYNRAEDADGIAERLRRDRYAAVARGALTGILGGLAAAVSIAEQIRTSAGMGLFFPGGKTGLLAFHTVVMVLCLLVGFPLAARGIKGLVRLRPNADTPVLLAGLAALAQGIALFFYEEINLSGMTLFAGLAGLEMALAFAGKAVLLGRIGRNFAFCASGQQLYSVNSIEDDADAEEIGRGLLMGAPEIKYSARVKFPSAFFELSLKGDPADRAGRIVTWIALAAGAAAAVAGGLMGHSSAHAFTALAVAMGAAVPAAFLLSTNLPMMRLARQCLPEGAMVSGFPAVADCEHANAIVFDSSDIFARGGCSIHGIKTYHNMRIDEAILQTAALVIGAGGPCGEIFDRVIEGRRDLLPEIEELRYEDKLGLSAWVAGRRVLVGNREMLQHHNIETPSADSERKYRHDGRQVMYLSVSGKLAAMFVVSYMINEDIAARLRQIIASGVTVLIRTMDANITDELVEDIFGLEPNSVKIINSKAAAVYKRYHDRVKGKAPAYILHDGRLNSFLLALSGALGMNSRLSILILLQKIACTVNAAMVLIMVFLSAFTQIGMWQILILQAVWTAITLFLCVRRR